MWLHYGRSPCPPPQYTSWYIADDMRDPKGPVRYVLIGGVHLANESLDRTQLGRKLMSFWPRDFASERELGMRPRLEKGKTRNGSPEAKLVAHAGILDVAEELFFEMKPFLGGGIGNFPGATTTKHVPGTSPADVKTPSDGAPVTVMVSEPQPTGSRVQGEDWARAEGGQDARPLRFHYGGHSLGGPLAIMLSIMAFKRLKVPAQCFLPTHCFGSPPLMAWQVPPSQQEAKREAKQEGTPVNGAPVQATIARAEGDQKGGITGGQRAGSGSSFSDGASALLSRALGAIVGSWGGKDDAPPQSVTTKVVVGEATSRARTNDEAGGTRGANSVESVQVSTVSVAAGQVQDRPNQGRVAAVATSVDRETTASGSSVAIAAVSASSEALPASNAAVPPPGPARPVFPLLDNVRSFVIDIDVVPRAFLLVDPLYELARRLPALRNLLSWRGSLLGGDMLTDTRFLYENMGQVFFIEARGSRVRVSKLTPEEANSALILSIDKFISDPVNILQALMDHNHIRYERDLSSALLAAKFRQRVHTENTIKP
eukprot:jgi/Mesvir1/16708/Mv15096-RA.4